MKKAESLSLAKDEEDFNQFESKIDEVVKILRIINSNDKNEQSHGLDMADKFLGDQNQSKLSEDDFIVKIKENRTAINTKTAMEAPDCDKMAFMQEMERDATRRAKERNERESIAQNLRKLGNDAFRKEEYEKAISLYSKAIDHIKTSPALYNNRALSYIRMGLYKKAIIDVDFVLQKLDEKNLRSWLYRAKGYYFLDEQRDFEKSISEAKKNNPKELYFIEKVVAEILKSKE